MNAVQEYVEAFQRGWLGETKTEGLLGRVIRGRTPEDFETLTDDPQGRKLIFLTDDAGLAAMVGCKPFDVMIRAGWDEPYTVGKIRDGFEMKLVVFEEGAQTRQATWDGVLDLVCQAYPQVASRLERHRDELKRMNRQTFTDEIVPAFEREFGKTPADVDREGDSHPGYMTLSRFLQSADTAMNCRFFLYFSAVYLKELYEGDGHTYDSFGHKGMPEYLALNCPITELPNAEVVDLFPIIPPHCEQRPKRSVQRLTALPDFYDPEDVGRSYEPRLALVAEYARSVGLSPSSQDKIRSMLMGIDLQGSFVQPEMKGPNGVILQEAGTLMVPGAVDDLQHFIEFIYLNAHRISSILLTLDQHIPWQIFYGQWWKDRDGNPLPPMTFLTDEMIKSGEVRPVVEKEWSRKYVEQLGSMMIWPPHCMIGTNGAALMPALAEAIHWLAIARGVQPTYLFKGTVPNTEHYGPFAPCVIVDTHPQGGLNRVMMDQIASHDQIMVGGEAEDFCVREGMKQLLEYFGRKHPEVLQKVNFLRDCTSLVFPHKRREADSFLDQMAGQGVQITTTQALL